MRSVILFFIIHFILINDSFAQNGIFFSEYFEGTSNNKAIEIYNGINTGESVSLSRIRVRLYTNGSGTVGSTLVLGTAEDGTTTTLAWNSTFVIYHTSFATPINTNLPNAPTSRRVINGGVTAFNGDDALELQYDETGSGGWVTVDVFGQIGFDPGTSWGTGNTITADNGVIRKSALNTGRTNAAFTPSDFFDGRGVSADATLPVNTLGQHTCDSPLPVELTSFTASSVNGTVNLNWATATEVSNYGFDVERSADKSVWNKIGFVAGNGNSNSVKTYSYSDNTASAGTVYYRLKQLDTDGKYEYSKVVSVNTTTPDAFSVDQNFPNPFNPSTTIRFSLANSSNVKVDVYASNGELVHTLANQTYEAGNHAINFDASQLSAGIYLYRITAIDAAGKTFSAVKKMQLIK